MTEDPPGFFGRWSRRKAEALQGKPLQEPAPVAKVAVPQAGPAPASARPDAPLNSAAAASPAAAAPEKTLSLDDVRQLTGDADFRPFVARGVAPEVRNAAMKKLFADPHYNVMDGLDTYIDDYSRADPIPAAMLRQMTGARLLKIFDDEDAVPAPHEARPRSDPAPEPEVNPNNPSPETVAQSGELPDPAGSGQENFSDPQTFSQPEPAEGSGASQHDHAHPHLRLQPDHAAPASGAGRGTA